jgi:quercetin dioxygenase-like cupin family protein
VRHMEHHRRAFISPPGTGPVYGVMGDVYTIRSTGEQTSGNIALVEARVPPGGGPPPHEHSREDESFYVLEGELTFFTREGVYRAGPGTFVHLPRGVAHAFKNESDREVRMLFWCSPAGFDEMVKAMGVLLPSRDAAAPAPSPAEAARLMEVCPNFGIKFVDKL